jgi:hypothetical protein
LTKFTKTSKCDHELEDCFGKGCKKRPELNQGVCWKDLLPLLTPHLQKRAIAGRMTQVVKCLPKEGNVSFVAQGTGTIKGFHPEAEDRPSMVTSRHCLSTAWNKEHITDEYLQLLAS